MSRTSKLSSLRPKLKPLRRLQRQGNEVEKEQLSAQLAEALAGIQTTHAQLFQEYARQLADMHGQALSTAQPQVIVHAPPRARVKHIERQNGKLVPVYEDQVQQAPQQEGAVMGKWLTAFRLWWAFRSMRNE
jgi:hypothetical protein